MVQQQQRATCPIRSCAKSSPPSRRQHSKLSGQCASARRVNDLREQAAHVFGAINGWRFNPSYDFSAAHLGRAYDLESLVTQGYVLHWPPNPRASVWCTLFLVLTLPGISVQRLPEQTITDNELAPDHPTSSICHGSPESNDGRRPTVDTASTRATETTDD